MSRRKGEQPIPKILDTFSSDHPVAHAIRTGSNWFGAWQRQKCIPYVKLSRLTGIPSQRFAAIEYGDRVSGAELEALARAWSVSAADLRASIPSPDIVID
ncbi:hypothetical protein [Sphingobium sp.]|uniref:hypothetical protein n=1 Tax=Sphingobium sp. TaxID=1912891 RepID=UPI0035C7786E